MVRIEVNLFEEKFEEKIEALKKALEGVKREFEAGNDLQVDYSWDGVITDGHPRNPRYWTQEVWEIRCGKAEVEVRCVVPSGPMHASYGPDCPVSSIIEELKDWAREAQKPAEGEPKEEPDGYDDEGNPYWRLEDKDVYAVSGEYRQYSGCGFFRSYETIFARRRLFYHQSS